MKATHGTHGRPRDWDAADHAAIHRRVQRSAEEAGWTRHVPTWTEARQLGAENSLLRLRIGFAIPLSLFLVATAIGLRGRIEYFSKLWWSSTSRESLDAYDERLTVDLLALLVFALAAISLRFFDARVADVLRAPRRWLWRRRIRRTPAVVVDRSASIGDDSPAAHRHFVLLEVTDGDVLEVTTNRRTRRKLSPGTAIYAFLHGSQLLEYRRYRHR